MLPALDVALKGAVVLALALAASRLLRRGSAATRYLVWSAALAGLLLLPLFAAVVPAWQPDLLPKVPAEWQAHQGIPTFGAPRASKTQKDMVVLPRPTPRAPAVVPGTSTGASAALAGPRVSEGSTPGMRGVGAPQHQRRTAEFPASEAEAQASPTLQRATLPATAVPTWPALLVGIYLCGAAALLLQLAAGAVGVVRMVRRAQPVSDGPLRREFEAAVAELGIVRPVMLLETAATAVPLAWELGDAVVLVPPGAHGWPAERRRVALLHELAHVQRRDCPVQLLALCALALHWLNPLAWLAVRRLRREREHACDDTVLRLGTRASDYADHLLQIARGLRPADEPAWASLAMARSGQLEGRVAAILDPHNSRRLPQRRNLMIALITSLALLLPLSALQPGVAAQTAERSAVTHRQPMDNETSAQTAGVIGSSTSASTSPSGARSASPSPSASASSSTSSEGAGSAQGTQPTIDELVQMRIHGVSIEFIEEVRAAFGRPVSVRELVQMRIHGTTPEFVRGVQEAFPDGELTVRDVTNMRIHGASLDYIREMRAALGDALSMDDIADLRIHGATPEFARAMGDLLRGEHLTTRDITSMRIHGATEEFVREMRDLLEGQELSVRDITNMRIHGVTTELVRELRDDGFEDLTADDLVNMKIHGFDRWLKRRRGGR